MKDLKADQVKMLTDTQLYAFSRCKLPYKAMLPLLQKEMLARQIDFKSHENRFERLIHEPLPNLSPEDEVKIWIMATLMPLGSGSLLIRTLFMAYFRKNPKRFQSYWNRSILTCLAGSVLVLCYFLCI